MKAAPDVNDTLREDGAEGVRNRHDRAQKLKRDDDRLEREQQRGNGNAGSDKHDNNAFPLIAFENIVLDTSRRDYSVKGLLPRTGIVVVWGPPKCGKSFWATDIGLFIAFGWEYRGRRVQQATVVYIALEGRHGFPKRIEAFKKHHGVQSAPFHLITKPLDLIRKADVLIASIEAQLGDMVPGVVFIDTLNRSLSGSESKDEDMAAYLAAASKIEEKFGCLVVIVHHCGIDATRPRGHTSISGTVEVQIAVRRGNVGEVIAVVELAKDMEEGAEIFSRLDPVDVGADPDGDRITSLVVLPVDGSVAGSKPKPRLAPIPTAALRALFDLAADGADPHPYSERIPMSVTCVTLNRWREHLSKIQLINADKGYREQFRRIHVTLKNAGVIGIWEDFVWPVT
jgi:hypothetical protein